MKLVLIIIIIFIRAEQDEVGMESYRRAQLAREQGVWEKEVMMMTIMMMMVMMMMVMTITMMMIMTHVMLVIFCTPMLF